MPRTHLLAMLMLLAALWLGACTPVTPPRKPSYVIGLEEVFGPPSQAGFGSAVFYDERQADLEQAALARYRYFTGELWARYGAEAWLGAWQRVYTRPPGADQGIVAELRALPDRAAAQSAALLLDESGDPLAVQAALAAAFDGADVTALAVYAIGDGGALSGVLVAARRGSGATVVVVFLLD